MACDKLGFPKVVKRNYRQTLHRLDIIFHTDFCYFFFFKSGKGKGAYLHSMPTTKSASGSQTQCASSASSSALKSSSAGGPRPHVPGVGTTGTTTMKRTKVRHVPWTEHTLRQLKLVLPGAAITYYLGTLNDFWGILQGTGGAWAR